MKALNLESKEFRRVLHNLHPENVSPSPDIQIKISEFINSKTPTCIIEPK